MHKIIKSIFRVLFLGVKSLQSIIVFSSLLVLVYFCLTIAKVNLPSEILPVNLYEGLCAREAVLSTAVGNGIAIPHSQQPLLKNPKDQRIFICYLKNPIDMNAMDNKKVQTLIIPLSSSVQSHLQIISLPAQLLSNSDLKKALELKLGLNEIYPLIRRI